MSAELGQESGRATLRPAVLPDDVKVFLIPVTIGSIIAVVGGIIGNLIMVVLPLIMLAVFPGLPILFHFLFHLMVKIEILDDRLKVTDYASNAFVKAGSHQEILFNDISYVYYLGREINLLTSLRNKLKEFNIAGDEADYTKDNLVRSYGVPERVLTEFESSSQKGLTDYAATGVLMRLEEIYAKYRVPKKAKNRITKALKDESNFNLDYLKSELSRYSIDREDLEMLKSEFDSIDGDVLAPFLMTKVDIGKYRKTENQRHGVSVTAKTDNVLVLSNNDGTKKTYLMHFHDLSDKDLRHLFGLMHSKKRSVKYLMTKQELKRLTR